MVTRAKSDLLERTDDRQNDPEKWWKVLIWNDDVTSMDFVVRLLVKLFHKNTDEACAIMMNVHQQGSGIAGVYVREIAETKLMQAIQMVNESKYPLKLTIEEA